MQKFLRVLFLLGLGAACVHARDIGDVVKIVDTQTIPIRVTANVAELQRLAQFAFNTHGRYDLRGARPAYYDIAFTAGGGNQVRVDVKRSTGGTVVASETVSGANAREALLRAADVAVAKTNAMGLRGYFSARLAFVGEGTGAKEIYLSDLFMQDIKRATNDRAQVLKPRWAPDGSRLLFTSYLGGFPDIYSYDLRSYQRTKFVGYKGTNMGAQFSPNGAQVAMILTGEGSSEIYVRSAAGGASPRRLTRSEQVKSSPCWSPDGARIVFAMDPGPQLYVISAGGGAPSRLGSGFSYMAEPDWSRTSNKIACTVRVGGGRYQIAVIEAGGGQAKVVSNADFDAIEPSWLADGRHLVYTARDRRSSVLCILDTETGRSTALPTSWPAGQASVWTSR